MVLPAQVSHAPAAVKNLPDAQPIATLVLPSYFNKHPSEPVILHAVQVP